MGSLRVLKEHLCSLYGEYGTTRELLNWNSLLKRELNGSISISLCPKIIFKNRNSGFSSWIRKTVEKPSRRYRNQTRTLHQIKPAFSEG
jgi:hypothetical protein